MEQNDSINANSLTHKMLPSCCQLFPLPASIHCNNSWVSELATSRHFVPCVRNNGQKWFLWHGTLIKSSLFECPKIRQGGSSHAHQKFTKWPSQLGARQTSWRR
jgi:hypothetical protein